MPSNEILKTVIEYNKAAFDCACKSLVIFEGYTEKIAENLLGQNDHLPGNQIDAWGSISKQYKSNRNEMIKSVEKNFDQMKSLFK